jgi:hypothetical protein
MQLLYNLTRKLICKHLSIILKALPPTITETPQIFSYLCIIAESDKSDLGSFNTAQILLGPSFDRRSTKSYLTSIL